MGCFQGIFRLITTSGENTKATTYAYEEKEALIKTNTSPRTTIEDEASKFLSILLNADKCDEGLRKKLQRQIHDCGWSWADIAEKILEGLDDALKKGIAVGQAVKDASLKAAEEAVDFAKDHPVYCTIIAIGILVIIAPWVLEVLGFGELGPIEGSFAAGWQSQFPEYVTKGSLFAFLQRLGMTWK